MKAIMEDFRLQAVGGMAGAIDVWEMGICAKLLANCGSWVAIGKKAYKQLNELQNSYLRMTYSCPPSTPLPSLRALAGLWDMEHKVAMEKVNLVTTILHNREDQNYARELLKEELFQGWEGITKEVQSICREMGLPDATAEYVSREKIKEAISYHNLATIKKEMEGKSKCDLICNRDFRKMQDFMKEKSLEKSRIEVLWLTNMIDTRATMKGKYRKYNCPHCTDGLQNGTLETPSHLMECQAYAGLRQGINPEEDQKDRPFYLMRVIARRKELEAKIVTADEL